MCEDMNKKQFVNWWIQTQSGHSKHQSTFWDQKGLPDDICADFEQVAHFITGQPKVMCKHCGAILNHPRSIVYSKAGGAVEQGTAALRRHLERAICRTGGQSSIQRLVQKQADTVPEPFSETDWERQLISTVAALRLPFATVEHPEFLKLLQLAQKAPGVISLPSRQILQRRIQARAQDQRKEILRKLPPKAKLSISLDFWTSPLQQAFMAVSGYFIDANWEYQEVLLGFEPLPSVHTGVYLSTVVLDLLGKHEIKGRILTVTIGGASNNSTLISSLQESLRHQGLGSDAVLTRVPGLVHVIQLSLEQLLGQLKISPVNDNIDTAWSEEYTEIARQTGREYSIANTLKKVRNLAIFINASPQRRGSFQNLQSNTHRLFPIQDVQTRWTSTFLMLRRAKKLQPVFDTFCSEFHNSSLQVTSDEWRQVDYLICVTQPFYKFITALSRIKDVTIHTVLGIYKCLFDHLKGRIHQLQRKKVGWKQQILEALRSAEGKLRDYYTMADLEGLSDIYSTGTILAPQYKLGFFQSPGWQDHRKDLAAHYKQALEDRVKLYEDSVYNSPTRAGYMQSAELTNEIDILLARNSQPTEPVSELTQYLESGTVLMRPREFWKGREHGFPALAALARDILSVPATGASVKRLFNSARDICHYHHDSLQPSTIQDLMFLMCSARFDLEDEQLAFVRKCAVESERDLEQEEIDGRTQEDIIEISDNEESLLQCNPKRRRRSSEFVEKPEDEPEPERSIPRVSGRIRKRSRLLDGYEI